MGPKWKRRAGWSRATARVMAALVAAMLVGLGFAQAASADQNVNFTLDRGVIKMSDTWANIVDPDLTPPDSPATLAANVADDGTLTAPKKNFTFPDKRIEGLETGVALLPVVDAKIQIAADGDITGNFDLTTGAAEVNIPAVATITVYSAGEAASFAKCKVSGMTFGFATTGQMSDPGDPAASPPRPPQDYDAANFAPPSGDGAMIAPWAALPASTVVSGAGDLVCPAVDGLIGGPGGLWLSGEATPGEAPEPVKTPPTAAPEIGAAPPASTEETSANFTFTKGAEEDNDVTGFQCSLDSGAFAACDSGSQGYSNLAVGDHTFQVKATNEDGEGPAATYSWKVTQKVTPPPPPPGKAKLGNLKIKPKNKAVKRGKKVVFKVKVKNAGNAAATGVKVCVKAPKKLVKVKKCAKVGKLAAGKARTVKFKVKVKKKARKGKKAVLKFKATAKGVKAKNGKAKVKVK